MIMKLTFILLFYITLLSVFDLSQAKNTILLNSKTTLGWHYQTLSIKGLQREFKYFIPTQLNKTIPLVILLHGGTQNMDKLFKK